MSEHVNPEVSYSEHSGYGARIKERREVMGLGQAELAERVGVTRPRVSLWETEKSAPTWANLERIARALDVTPSWIMSGDQVGHMVVRETGQIDYDPNPDPEGTPAEQLMAFLGVRVGMRRLAGELTAKDLIAVAYTLARSEGFSAEEYRKLDAWRDQVLEAERRGGS